MCIVALAWKESSNYPVKLFSNRDEYYHRPTQALSEWSNGIIAAKDMKAGGTWLGFNKKGQWATLTNFREGSKTLDKEKISRGLIVSDYLSSDLSPEQFAKKLDLDAYNGFTLLLGDLKDAYVIGNRSQSLRKLENGLYILSNGKIEEPWPKALRLKQRLTNEIFIERGHDTYPDIDSLNDHKNLVMIEKGLSILQDQQQAPDHLLPNTGIPQSLEKLLSSIFIQSPTYGTSASTILEMSDKEAAIYQTYYDANGSVDMRLKEVTLDIVKNT